MENKISATIVADSINKQGNRITTMKVVFPRFILAEFNTHRLFTRNSASSRAIPVKKMLKMIEESPFLPIAWQEEHSGMQGTKYLEGRDIDLANGRWLSAMRHSIEQVRFLAYNIKATKQLANRLLEPFMYHTVLVTFTESKNFFELRSPRYTFDFNEINRDLVKTYKSKKDAIKDFPVLKNFTQEDWLKANKGQGEIHIMDLAEKMWDAMNNSVPRLLKAGEWHIPFGDNINLPPTIPIDAGYTLEEGVQIRKAKIAVARCARLSYETLGDNPVIDHDKDLDLYEILKASGHFSPFEHVARAMTEEEYYTKIKGEIFSIRDVVAKDSEGYGWDANFRGFIQMRSLLES